MIFGPDSPAAKAVWERKRLGFIGVSDLLPRAATWLIERCGRTLRTTLLSRILLEAGDEYARLAALDLSRASLRDKAWITRNLLELVLTYLFVYRSDAQLRQLVEHQSRDHIDIIESLAALSDHKEDAAWAENERTKVEAVAAAGNLRIPKRVLRTSDMATIVGWEEEYRAVYKLYSKYVHPTPWCLCSGGGASQFLDDNVRMTLVGRATAYARELLMLIAEDAEAPNAEAPAGIYDEPLPPPPPDTFAAPLLDKEIAHLLAQL